MNNQEEIWKDIPNYEGYYQVSNLGRVRSLDRVIINKGFPARLKGMVLKQKYNKKDQYLFVDPCINAKNKTLKIHRAVALAFLENPLNKPQVNHINGIKTDNRVENLEWATSAENMRHAVETGLMKRKGEKHPLSKLNNDLVLKIRGMAEQGMSYKNISIELGIPNNDNVRLVAKRQSWKHI